MKSQYYSWKYEQSKVIYFFYLDLGESKLGRLVDALAHGGDEGRDKLR